jgi:hypothetical protein
VGAAAVLLALGALVQSRLPLFPAGRTRDAAASAAQADGHGTRAYTNRLAPVRAPAPLLARHPRFVARLAAPDRLAGPALVVDAAPTLRVRAWRYSYNARAVIEIPNELDGRRTAILLVHPWGIDDGQGWVTPAPAGVAFFGTPAKNAIYHRHLREVVHPFLERLRPRVALVAYSLPGAEDPARRDLYRSPRAGAGGPDRAAGTARLHATLGAFSYRGEPLPEGFPVRTGAEVSSYFQAFRGLDASERYDPAGYWQLPVPLAGALGARADDIVYYDEHGYDEVRAHLLGRGIRHVLLGGYATDLCLRTSTAGYDNLRRDFNVFIVGDATLATFPAQESPAMATAVALAQASLENLITETGWIGPVDEPGR